MPAQAPLRLVKGWERYEKKENRKLIPRHTRGLYVLYQQKPKKEDGKDRFDVVYIGVAGVRHDKNGGIQGRLNTHARLITNWTHFSAFEVHDNVSREEILELESLLLTIFRRDPRIRVLNKQKGSKQFSRARRQSRWNEQA